MGQDKALLVVDGEQLAARVAHQLTLAGCAPVVLVGRQPALSALPWRVVDTERACEDHHPLWGVWAALQDAALQGAPAALLAPCDLPGLSAADLRRLAQHTPPAVGMVDGWVQPLLAYLPTSVAARAKALALQNGRARDLVSDPQFQTVEMSAAAALDLDTPEDVAEWLRFSGHQG